MNKTNTALARLGSTGVLLLTLAGCAGLAPQSSLEQVQQQSAELTGQDSLHWATEQDQPPVVRERIAELLAEPLALESAVEIALMNNPGLQARLFDLGIADAQRVQA
ncbi:RND transporter, partial [Halopseudomonas pelagia]